MPTMQANRGWISNYYPSFNGLRGVAILLVYLNHYGAQAVDDKYVRQLWFGVDVFFVLSGFLITGILYDSREDENYFRNFYVRRALRIFPLYYGFFVLLYLATPFLHMSLQPFFWTNLLYLSNFVRLFVNPTYAAYGTGGYARLIFGHLWSLCVEEQFYLVWPLVLWFLPSRKAIMQFAASAALACFLLRVGLYFSFPATNATTGYLYWSTPTRCDGLFMGAWVALWLRGARLTRLELRRVAFALIIPSVTVLVVGAATIGTRWKFNERNPLLATYGYSLVDLASVGILLLALDNEGRFAKALRMPLLAKLGIISYGFYFFHAIYEPRLFLLRERYADIPHSGVLFLVAGFAINVVVAAASYNLYERHFLKLKDRFAAPTRHSSIPSGEAAVLVPVSHLRKAS